MIKQLVKKLSHVIVTVWRNPIKLVIFAKFLRTHGLKGFVIKFQQLFFYSSLNDQYQIWLKQHTLNNQQFADQRKLAAQFTYRPLISIIVPTYNTNPVFLRACLTSVLVQTYDKWQLCIADDASSLTQVRTIITEYAQNDARINVVYRTKNGHICQASNTALTLAKGTFVSLLDHDDILWPNALFEVVKALNTNKKLDLIYSDEDFLGEDGKTHLNPEFKPNWSPDYLRSINYITHFVTYRRSLIKKVGGFRKGLEGAQDWDLLLRVGQLTNRIHHIPTVLYSWRKSATSTASERHAHKVKLYALDSQKKAFGDDLKRRGYKGEVIKTNLPMEWRVKYAIIGKPLVSIIIPTKDKVDYLERCVTSISKKSTYQNYEIILVDTGSKEQAAFDYYQKLTDRNKLIRVIHFPEQPFNFSKSCNFGATTTKGQYLLFLNNDTEVVTPDWIEGMLEHAQRKEVGAVGAKLLYPSGAIQHLGGLLGITAGGQDHFSRRPGHAFKSLPKDFLHHDREAVKNYSFVTAACLMVAKDKFQKVKGFAPEFRIAFNDVDFCLKLMTKLKLHNLVTPHVTLVHYESVSVKATEKSGRDMKEWQHELNLYIKRWNNLRLNDPYFNPNFSYETERLDRLNLLAK